MMNKNTSIMHKVWNNSYSNAITQPLDIERVCDIVYDSFGTQGDGGYYACQSALQLCIDSPSQCSEALIWEKYSEALKQGYTSDYQTFKRRSQVAGYITNVGQLLQGFFQNQNQAPTQQTNVMPEQKSNTTPLIIGGVILLIGLGAGIYFLTKK